MVINPIEGYNRRYIVVKLLLKFTTEYSTKFTPARPDQEADLETKFQKPSFRSRVNLGGAAGIAL